MTDIRVKDLTEATVPGADYFLLTDSATDGVKKVKTTNVVTPAGIGAASLAGTETLTNKTISGASNTLTNVPNSALTNSGVTVSGHPLALGGTLNLVPADLGTIADSTILSNVSGALASSSANTITAVMDKQFGTAQGSVVYRSATGWASLAPGVLGQYLKTQGTANPIWDTPAGGGDMLKTIFDPTSKNADAFDSANTKFLQAGTGAVASTVSAKLKRFVSFMDFGAVGDGVADDTAAVQATITAYPSNTTILGGGKTYKITSALALPAGSQYLTITNALFTVSGDIQFLSVASGTALFFEMDRVYIAATAHTTFGRVLIDISLMSNFAFRKVWVSATSGKTICFQGTGTGGASPYYGNWTDCYGGNFFNFVRAVDAATIGAGMNSNHMIGCRIQPGTGNIGVYIGQHSQDFKIIATRFESSGGTGVYMRGEGHSIDDGCRFEGLTTGVDVQSDILTSAIHARYWSGCTTNIAWASPSRQNVLLTYDPDANGAISAPGAIVSRSATGGIGYATGAGSTVTQATSKTTAVTLNTVTGKITMNNAALAASATAAFLVNNSTSAVGDVVVINLVGGATFSANYQVWVESVGSGAFVVCMRNITAGSLSEALVLQYALIKGATA